MSSRPGPEGRPTCSLRSKRPGRSSAGSRVVAWLVAPMTITLYWGILGLPRCRIRLTWRHSPLGMIMPSIWTSSSLTYMLPPPMPMPPMMIRSGPLAQWRLVSAGELALDTAPRLPPTASSSSRKITAPPYLRDSFRAFLNSRMMRRLPMPMNMLLKLVPEAYTNGTLADPAMALPSRVLPVPGGPSNRTPWGG